MFFYFKINLLFLINNNKVYYIFIISLKLLEKHSETFRDDIKTLLKNRIFFQDVEELIKLLKPIKEVIVSLEYKSTSLSDCFIQLMKLGIAFKSYPTITNILFRSYCIDKFNHRWRQFDFKIYLLGYFFHPSYRGIYNEFLNKYKYI
jgi:hypothetical protein